MFPFGAAVSVVLAWLAARFGLPILVWLLGAKLLFGLLYGYLRLLPVHGRELAYYRNLSIRPGVLLGVGWMVDMLLFTVLIIFACSFLYPCWSDAIA